MLSIKPKRIGRTGDDSPATSLISYVWRMSGWHQVSICALALVVAALSMAPLELQRRIINNAVESRDIDLFVVLGLLYLAVVVVQGGLKLLLRLYQGWLSESAVRYCREHLAGLLDVKRRNEQEGEHGGGSVAVLTTEIDKLGGFVGEGLSQPVVNVGMLFAIMGYMLFVEPLVAVFSLALLMPQFLVVPLLQSRLNNAIESRLVLIRDVSDAINRDEQAESRFSGLLDRVFSNRMRIYAIKFVMKGIVNLLNAIAPLGVLLVGGYFVIEGETTIGVVVAFMSGVDRLADPMRELISYYRIAAQTNVQHRMIAKWM